MDTPRPTAHTSDGELPQTPITDPFATLDQLVPL
jgi:hypothetical protein